MNEKDPGEKKRKYVPGLALLEFEPTYDWSIEEARRFYDSASSPMDVDAILYQDCIDGMKALPEACIDLIVADPPFGIDFSGKESLYNRKSELVVDGYQEITEDYDQFTQAWIQELPRIMKDHASAYIFSGWTNLEDVLAAIRHAGLNLVNHIIWKYQFGAFTTQKFVSSHYHILFLSKNENQRFFNKIEHYPEDVWTIPRTYLQGQKKNGTKLPEDVVSRCIHFSSKPGDLVLDPFMGNATTAICAKMHYRHYLGFEINEEMKSVQNHNLDQIKVGEHYRPYESFKPTEEEILQKYPHLQKYIKNKKNQRNKQKPLTDYS